MGINSPRDEFLLRFHGWKVGEDEEFCLFFSFCFFQFCIVSSSFFVCVFFLMGEIMKWVRDSRETLDDGYWEGN